MSYARFSYADVYVFLDCYGTLRCCGCWLDSKEKPIATDFQTTAEMLEHLNAHRAAGHDVPDETYEGLRAEAPENDAWMAKVADGMCPKCSGDGKCHPNHEIHTVHRREPCPDCGNTNTCRDCKGRGGSKDWASRGRG